MGHRTAVALAIIVAVPGAAVWASATEGPAPTIHACVDGQNGQLRIASPGDRCRRHESPLVWNSDGPAGPQGEPGPAGPAGEPAAPGISGWEQVTSAPVMLPAGGTRSAVARCPAGKQVFGGGFISPGPGATVVESHPAPVAAGSAGWIVWARNPSGPDSTLTAYAICATAT